MRLPKIEKRNRMVIYQFRHCGRPVFGHLRSSLALKRRWEDVPGDHVFVVHGEGPVGAEIPEGSLTQFMDLRGKTNGDSPDIVRRLIRHAIDHGYEFVSFLDDDAFYSVPAEAYKNLLRAFEKNPNLAAIGPMDQFRSWRQYGANRSKMRFKTVRIEGVPWATLGSQIYRVKYLKRHVDLQQFARMKFRNDVFLFMSLFNAGRDLAHMWVPKFYHYIAGGFRTKRLKASRKDQKRTQRAILDSYEILWENFGDNSVLAPFLQKMRRTDLKYRGMPLEKIKKLPPVGSAV